MKVFQVARRGWTDIPIPAGVRYHVHCRCCAFRSETAGVRFVEYFERPTDNRPPWPMLCAHCWRGLPKAGRAKYSRIT